MYIVRISVNVKCRARSNLWTVKPDGSELRQLSTDTQIARAVLSSDGQRVAYLTIDPDSPTKSLDVTFRRELNQLKVLDTASGAAILNLSEHGDGIFSGRLLWTSPDTPGAHKRSTVQRQFPVILINGGRATHEGALNEDIAIYRQLVMSGTCITARVLRDLIYSQE